MTDDIAIDRGETTSWHPWLVGCLALLEVPRAVDEVVVAHVRPMLTQVPGHAWFALFSDVAQILGFIVAGVVADRLRVGIVACASLIASAILTAMATTMARTPLLLFGEHGAAVFVGVAFGVAGGVAVRRIFPFTRRARVFAVLNVAAVGFLIGLPLALHALHWPPNSFARPAWAAGALPMAGATAILAVLLWRPLRRLATVAPAPHHPGGALADVVALLRRPGILPLVLVMTCHMLMLTALLRVLYSYIEFERGLPQAKFVPAVVPPLLVYALGQAVIAFRSDARARETRRPALARTPIVVVGAALSAAIGLIPLVPNGGLQPLYWLVGLGMAGFPLVFTLGFDIVPASLAGRFFGVAMAIVLLIAILVFLVAAILVRPMHSLAVYFYVAGIASLVGAVISYAKLRHIEPIEDGPGTVQKLGEVFA